MKFTKLLVLGALLLVGSGVAKAADWNVRTAPTVADVKAEAVEFEADHQYLLYNTGAKMFFSQGNSWGTKASGHADQAQALRMFFTKYVADGSEWDGQTYIFKIYSSVRSTSYSWHDCFFDNAAAMYVDRASQVNFYWEVQDMGNKVYRLKAAQANPDIKSDGTQFVGRDDNVGQDTNNLSDVYDNANAYPLSPMLTGAEGQYIDWVFYDASIFELYEAAEELKAEAEAAEIEGVDISAAVAVYNNANATLAELKAALADIKNARQGNMANATADKPADATSFIVNPDFKGDDIKTGWSGTGWGSYNPKENAERYETFFDTYQDIEGLPNGVYALGVNAFFRAGSAGAALTNYLANNAESKYLKLYAKTTEDSLYTSICSPFKGAPTVQQNQGTESSASYNGITYWIPNNMVAAEYYMHNLGLYKNRVFVAVEDGKLRIGATRQESDGAKISSEWGIFDDFSLTYYGGAADAFQKWYDLTVDDLDVYNYEITDDYTAKYLEDYNAVFEAARAAKVTTKAEVLTAVNGLDEKADAVVSALSKNIDLWKQFEALIVEARSVAADINLDPAYTEELGDWCDMEGPEAVEALMLTNEELEATIAEMTAKVDEARKHPVGSDTDMTNLLKNPDFSKGSEGWTIERASGGNVTTGGTSTNTCFEAWNNAKFDIYQEVENAPVGVYEISVQGFYRYGRTAYKDYLDQTVPEVKNAPVYIYLNDNTTSFTNVYGDPKQITDEDFYKSGSSDYVSETGSDDVVYFYPNGMASAAIAFSDGMYTQAAYGLVANAGDKMRIGVKGSSNQLNDSWSIWDNFRLVYKGYDADVIKPILEVNIEKSEKTLENPMGKEVAEELQAAINEAKKAVEGGDGTAMFKALSDLFATNNNVNESIAKFEELNSANENLANEIEAATQCALSTLEEARTLNLNITTGIDNRILTNEDADKLLEEIAAMIKKLHIPDGMETASDDNPFNATAMIINPTYDAGNNNGWTLDQTPGFSSGVIEVYNNNFDEYQELEGMPAGTYNLTVQGFYRYGFADNEYKTYTEDPTANNYLQLYVKVGDEDEISVAMPRLASDGSEEHVSTKVDNGKFVAGDDLSDGDAWQWTWMTEPVAAADSSSATGVRIINGMIPVANAFADGKFGSSSITFKVGEEGKARIGLKKQEEKNTDGSWCIWDTWKLTYYGPNSTKETTTGINSFANIPVGKSEFYSLNGARISSLQRGVVIVKQTMADGTVKVRKVVVK